MQWSTVVVFFLMGRPQGMRGHELSAIECPHATLIHPMTERHMRARRELPLAAHAHAAGHQGRRALLATEPRALRIHVDMQLSNLDASLSAYVEEELAPAAVAAISRYIQVKEPMPGALQLPRVCAEYVTLYNGTVLCSSVEPIDTCGEGDWTATHNASYFAGYEICDCPDAAETSPDVDCTCTFTEGGGGVPDVDFVLYVTSGYLQACERSTVAVGSYCSQDVSNHRPLAGFANLCPNRIENATAGLVYMQQLDILVHEILHGLVMDDGLYDYFIDSSGKRLGKHNVVQNFTERGVRVHKIVTPKVREAAAAQLACTPLNGAELENEGGLNMVRPLPILRSVYRILVLGVTRR
ncbi:hypothetical protein CYMTET_8735 [Cymbomonas tetramitiformis]|uniref:Leishmanolysin-like peptidase n=1 Tax=Cymbomonas tetramitiformis TaxID=36881 RepID=A0AAE0GSX1_9CHLO|nr:hypothetical protein CYMTET_8735 [Cymbomonas tetramitiformis]